MLRLSRFPGSGVYIGRAVRVTVAEYFGNGATLTVECGEPTAVSGPDVSGLQHALRQHQVESGQLLPAPGPTVINLHAGELVSIGRGIVVTVMSAEHDGEVQLGIDAPKHQAVSRDDFTLADHLRWQDKRDAQYGGSVR